jgi:hypothetical protein
MMRPILVVSALSLLTACASAPRPPKKITALIGLNCPLGWYISVEGCVAEKSGEPFPTLTECPKGTSAFETHNGIDCIFGSWSQRTAYMRGRRQWQGR